MPPKSKKAKDADDDAAPEANPTVARANRLLKAAFDESVLVREKPDRYAKLAPSKGASARAAR